MKVVFLDIDGVLNGSEWMKGVTIQSLLEKSDDEIDPSCVARLNTILARTGARVVLSSSWRVLAGLSLIESLLRRKGFTGEFHSRTPNLRFQGRVRGDEIRAWLECQRPAVERFVILDDDSDMGELESQLILTNNATGLSQEDVERAVKLLGEVRRED